MQNAFTGVLDKKRDVEQGIIEQVGFVICVSCVRYTCTSLFGLLDKERDTEQGIIEQVGFVMCPSSFV
jgi:hypothetical protein